MHEMTNGGPILSYISEILIHKIGKWMFVLICLIALSLSFICLFNNKDNQEEYFYQINYMIKNIDFSSGEIIDQKIMLYDSKDNLLKMIAFDEYDNQPHICIRKDGDIIYFIEFSAVDDECGIMFVNSDSNRILDGVNSLERIGGNSYRYTTMAN